MRKNTKTLLWGIALVALLTASLKGLSLFEDYLTPSQTSEVDEIPVYNIAARPDHPFEAINEEVILTVTVLPADASDKTVEWTSSDATKVSVTKMTDTTAKIKCLTAFTGEVTITATATNGTATTDDDFSASCVCTYVVPVTAIELEWEGSTGIDPTTHVFDIGDTIYFSVNVLPANATTPTYQVVYDDSIFTESVLEPYSTIQLDIIFETPIGVLTDLVVVSDYDEAITDTVSMQVGEEYDEYLFYGNSHISKYNEATEQFVEIGANLGDYVAAYDSYGISFDTGDIINLEIFTEFKSNAVTFSMDSTYINLMNYTPDGTSYEVTPLIYIIYSNTFFSQIFIQFEVIAPITEFNLEIMFTNYNLPVGIIENIPFTFFRPVSGISIDEDTYVF